MAVEVLAGSVVTHRCPQPPDVTGGLSRFPVTLITRTLTGSCLMTAAFPDGLKMTETSRLAAR